jgi:hypothetical protein
MKDKKHRHYSSSSDSEDFVYNYDHRNNYRKKEILGCDKNCKGCNKCGVNCKKIIANEIIATGCLIVQTEQADPEWIRGPITIVSTTTGSTNINLTSSNTTLTSIGNVTNPSFAVSNTFESSPPLAFPPSSQIPQGVFVSNSAVFQGSKLPNYVNIMETKSSGTICTWRCAREIYSKFYIQNISGLTIYNVGFVLIAYTNNGIQEIATILDQDVKTLRPGDYGTFKVNWRRMDSGLPFQNDAIQIIIQTSVLLVNQLFTQQALADLVTFKFIYPALQPKIVLIY